MQKNILVVEDDKSIAEMVQSHLTKEGFKVVHAADGAEALRLFSGQSFDLVLLDLMLPELDGMDVLRIVREKSFVPVLILSAKDSDVDKAIGLGFGADDYVTKPFSLIELSARVKAALRRASQYSQTVAAEEEGVIQIHELTLDIEHYQVSKNGLELKLTAKELQILKLMMTNPKRAFSKEQIYRAVWKDDYYGDENAINVHISRLREKIEDDPSKPQYIKTVWGIGYKLGEF
ncbi:MAG: DNA-binding response regulator [Paenibacillus sp.]|nr:DNA-binding response regulator [Paenibacillus sp.]